MPEMLTRTGLGGRGAGTKRPLERLRDGLALRGEAASAWAVVERYVKDVAYARSHAGPDVLTSVEACVVADARRIEEEVRSAVAKLRETLSPEQVETLSTHVCEPRRIAIA